MLLPQLSLFIFLFSSSPGTAVAYAKREQRSAEQLTDRQISHKVRKSISEDRSLSPEARRATVDTASGKVTLRGAVRTEEEVRVITAKATEVVGAANVKSELTISR